jgi:hypothetical protein
MTDNPVTDLPIFDDDVERVVVLARKATRKAARFANRVGYFVEHAEGACVVKAPRHVLRVALKTNPIDVNKQYTFACASR